jgi:TolB-like protein/tRNA A-37 threonylcarbamoyl transferase component Bud32/tetratricopeptide (TPR) repeat protein
MSDTLARLRAALADRYRLERELGAGGMATVYLAEDLKHRRKVAVKVLRPELARALGPERFLREIETTAHLRHPHILPLFDSGEAGGFLFYAMPLVEGESLRDRLTREKQLPIDDALQIAREVADALSYAHARRIVHRDIKPENILLESGHAVVADFGIARAVSSAEATASTLTGAGLALGTAAYMSPEQVAGERTLDGRSDLYSLGCVLFEMLAGQPPFTGPTPEVLVRQHIAAAPPPVTQFRPAVPANVVEALTRVLAKNPADRFNAVEQFTTALQGGPGDRRTAGPPMEAAAKHRALALLALVILLLLMGGWWAMLARPGRPVAPSGPMMPPRSIAVLPFRNLRGDSTGDYFSDGVTEEILHALVQIPDLQVAARTSAFQFRGKAMDVREVGRRLNVAAVLEGSIQREGDEVRITTQLTDTRTGYQIWSGKFDRHLADLFVVEDEISRALADTLKVPLGLVARPVIRTTRIEAHDLYLRGLTLLAQRGPTLHQTIAYFQGAVASDSTFAPAWAGLAAAYELLPAYELSSYEEELPRAEHAARRAIALDSTLGPAYAVLASVYRDRMQWADAERAYARALRLAPNDAEAVEQYGQFLFWTGQSAAAVTQMELARKLDPLAPVPATTLGVAHLFLHHYDSAATLLRHASDLAPSLPLPWMWRMWTGLSAGRYDLAEQAGRRLAEVSGLDPGIYAGLIRGVADPRRRPEARALLARTPETAPWALSAGYRVNWFMLLGDTAAALDAVDRLSTRPTPNGILTLWNPPLDPIRDHPRFRATLQRLGLPFHGQGQP